MMIISSDERSGAGGDGGRREGDRARKRQHTLHDAAAALCALALNELERKNASYREN
jgi:hypothetical protein